MQTRHRTIIVLLALGAMSLCCAVEAAARPAAQVELRESALLESLAAWSGWTPQRLDELRATSGEDDVEDFAVAVVVALNLGVSVRSLIDDGARNGLVATLRGMGISSDTARREIRRAEQQVRDWRRQPPPVVPAAAPPSTSPGA